MQLPSFAGFDLSGKRAFVTGATSGIGLGAATALARAGAHVVCAARRAGPLGELHAAMEAEGLSCETQELDVTDVDATRAAFSGDGAFDIVVNSAGMARHGPALDTTPEDFDAVMNVNLRAAYFLSTAAADQMIAAGRPGSIIHVSSQMGHVGGRNRSVYCATKHAMEGFSKGMALDLAAHKIRVNTVCPTFIETALTKPFMENKEFMQDILNRIPLGHVGQPEDVAGAVLYLASDASRLVSGSSIKVDGGWTAV